MRRPRWRPELVTDSAAEVEAARRARDEAHLARLAAEAQTPEIRRETEQLRAYGQRNNFGASLMLGMRLRAAGA